MSVSNQYTTSYDELPYPSQPLAAADPDRLAGLAMLFGLRPPAVDRCRVLELGCATGGNLMPLADRYPESQFVGIDSSQRQITSGQQAAQHLGLTNLELEHLDIADLGPGRGKFDYILCHGVFSWVSRALQDKILEICRQQLSDNGVAYISYNTYPGWHLRHIIRQVALGSTSAEQAPLDRAQRATRVLQFLAESLAGDPAPCAKLMRTEIEVVLRQPLTYLFHEYLEADNHPLYFHEFAERIVRHELQYLGDAIPSTMFAANLGGTVAHNLSQISPDLVAMEQHMDVLRFRGFRRSLLCHRRVQLERFVRPGHLQGVYLCGKVRCENPTPDLYSAAVEKFIFEPSGRLDGSAPAVSTPYPPFKVAMHHLVQTWPRGVRYENLLAAVGEQLAAANPPVPFTAEDRENLGHNLVQSVATGVIEVFSHSDHFSPTVSSKPVASRLARWQAESMSRLTNRRHESVQLTQLSQRLVGYLDGKHDRAALLEVLSSAVERGELSILVGGIPATRREQVAVVLEESLNQQLAELAENALLVEQFIVPQERNVFRLQDSAFGDAPDLGLPLPQAQLEQVEAIAQLRQLSPRELSDARVLELGCGAGVSLLSLAESYPASQFVGIDSSAQAIAAAQAAAAELGQGNVEFRHQDVLRLQPAGEPFDYVITQRTYIHAEDQSRDGFLAICRDHLAPLGIAMVGYEVYPGWYLRAMLRHMMFYEARGARTPAEAMTRCRTLFDFLSNSLTAEQGAYQASLLAELELLKQAEDWQIREEILRTEGGLPFFRQFVAQAHGQGLQYIGDATVGVRYTDELIPTIEGPLSQLANDFVEAEQFRDVLRNRAVRHTLLCHAGRTVRTDLTSDQFAGLHLEARFRHEAPGVAIESTETATYLTAAGARITTAVPLIKAALAVLEQALPDSMNMRDLVNAAVERLRTASEGKADIDETEIERLRGGLLECCYGRAVEALSRPFALTGSVSEKPLASSLARWQAARGNVVVNRKHQSLRLDDLDRAVLALADGTRDEAALVEALADMAVRGQITARQDGQAVAERERVVELLAGAIKQNLAKLAYNGFLVA